MLLLLLVPILIFVYLRLPGIPDNVTTFFDASVLYSTIAPSAVQLRRSLLLINLG